VKRAIAKLNILRVSRAYLTWRSHVARDLLAVRSERRAIKFWRGGKFVHAWRKWRSHVDSARVALRLARHTAKLNAAVARRDSLRATWRAWRAYNAEYVRKANLVSKGYAMSRRVYKQSVFDQWLEYVADIERRKDTLRKCVTSKRLMTKWFLDWYWQAYEGDITSALGLITETSSDVIGEVFGENRGVNRGVFQQWQQLGAVAEAFSAPIEDHGAGQVTGVASRKAAAKWQGGGAGGSKGPYDSPASPSQSESRRAWMDARRMMDDEPDVE
jgi:protein SFI1